MEFRILGPVQVYDERSRAAAVPAGAKQRALLGALVVRAGRVVAAEQLVDELWGAYPPAGAANALQAHMTRLRRLLPARPPRGGRGGQGVAGDPPAGLCAAPGRRRQRRGAVS
ncbi:winged helix-turn-helix domain-containing protein [Streptomyces sp. R21]|uniref:Winged helix-turn-helix domain-containing protein n=1 Tax=Streptomyces sp. R21 TaxID=3238627 RepID=A0AB39P304_9ACTN